MFKVSPKLLPGLFLASAALAALQCFARSDYNLPLMVFAYVSWDFKNVKTRIFSKITLYRIFTDRE